MCPLESSTGTHVYIGSVANNRTTPFRMPWTNLSSKWFDISDYNMQSMAEILRAKIPKACIPRTWCDSFLIQLFRYGQDIDLKLVTFPKITANKPQTRDFINFLLNMITNKLHMIPEAHSDFLVHFRIYDITNQLCMHFSFSDQKTICALARQCKKSYI